MNVSLDIIDERALASAAADELVAAIQEVIAEKGQCSLVLSGGSTPGAIYRNLSRPPRSGEIEWDKVIFFWGDERWVSHQNSASNFKMAAETLFGTLNKKPEQVFAFDTSASTPEICADKYEQVIRSAGYLTDNFAPPFDIVLLGIGEDGHIASLFPGTKALSVKDKVCTVSANPAKDDSPRVSLTLPAILSANRIYVFAKGVAKAPIVARVFKGGESVEELPAQALMNQAAGRVSWFIDSLAASQIEDRESWL